MSMLRILLRSRSWALLALLGLMLTVRAMVPQGFMPVPGGGFALMPCPQVMAAPAATPPAMSAHHGHAMVAADHDGHDMPAGEHGKAEGGGCAFAPMGQAATAGADAVLLAVAIAFVLALGTARLCTPAPRRRAFVQPPLRGPPLPA